MLFRSRIRNQRKLLLAAANDEHGRVRLEAITAASSLDKSAGLPIIEAAKAKGLGKYSQQSYDFALGTLNQSTVPPREADPVVAPKHLTGAAAKLYVQGGEIYGREAHCTTCHQVDGKGLPDSGFPPVAGTGRPSCT